MNTTAVTLNDINLASHDLYSNGGLLNFDKDLHNRFALLICASTRNYLKLIAY